MMRQLLRCGLAMRHSAAAWACCALAGLLVGAGLPALAQTPTDVNAPPLRAGAFAGQPTVWDCGLDVAGHRAGTAARVYSANDRSYYGQSLTPRGDLRILIVCAGYNQDNIQGGSSNNQNNNFSDNPWPQQDATHSTWGTALPRAVVDNSVFYHDFSQFSATSPDNNLSMEYYHASRHVPGQAPFRVIATALPDRVNVDYEDELWDKIKQMYPGTSPSNTINWSLFDDRTNSPQFHSDNSVSASDSKIDFVIVLWRNVRGGIHSGGGVQGIVRHNRNPQSESLFPFPTGGLVAPAGSPFPTYQTGNTAFDGTTLFNGQAGFDRWTLAHEMQHCLIASPHYNNAHFVPGPHLHNSETFGLMNGNTNSCVHPWERWYMGWDAGTTGPNALPSHLEIPQDVVPGGLYTLRDYSYYGDAMRIRIPHTEQYLWLTNHTNATPLSGRYEYFQNSWTPPQAYPATELGLMATVEDMHTFTYADIISPFDPNRINGLRPVSSRGNFDYTPLGPLSMQSWYFGASPSYELSRGLPNAFGGQGDSQYFRWDKNNDGVIEYTQCAQGARTGCGNEQSWVVNVNGVLAPYLLGYADAFQQPGQKFGMMTNPALIPHLLYDPAGPDPHNQTIRSHGLSVEITQKLADGTMVVRVRFDDTEMLTDQRWTGDIALEDVPGAANGTDLLIQPEMTLTLDLSKTINRHTKNLVTNDFVNPTTMTCQPGTLLQLAPGALGAAGGRLIVKNGSDLTLLGGARLEVGAGGVVRVESGATLTIEDDAELIVAAGARIEVAQDAKLFIRNTVAGKGLQVLDGAELVVTGNGLVRVAPGARLDLQSAPVAGQPMLTLQDDASEILTYGLIQTADGVPFTFGGRGQITFSNASAALVLGAGSEWVQTGPARPNVMYRFLDGAQISVQTPKLDLARGRLDYDAGSSLSVEVSGLRAQLDHLDLAGDAASPGGSALTCLGPKQVYLTSCLIHDFATAGLTVTHSQVVTLNSSYVRDVSGPGLTFSDCGQVVLDRGSVTTCDVGVALTDAKLYLRNRYIVGSNRQMGIQTLAPGGTPNLIVAGDEGCAWIIDNAGGGIVGQDTWLDLDGPTHEQPTARINRFDGNTKTGGYAIDICYSFLSPAQPPVIIGPLPPTGTGTTPSGQDPRRLARGNYWGPGAAGTYEPVAGTDYRLLVCEGGDPAFDLVTRHSAPCQPVSCASCEGDGGDDGGNRVAASGAAPALALTLAPNPTGTGRATTLTLPAAEADASYQYRVVSGRGQTVAAGSFAGGALRLSTAGWPAGAYRVVVWCASGAPARASQTLLVE